MRRQPGCRVGCQATPSRTLRRRQKAGQSLAVKARSRGGARPGVTKKRVAGASSGAGVGSPTKVAKVAGITVVDTTLGSLGSVVAASTSRGGVGHAPTASSAASRQDGGEDGATVFDDIGSYNGDDFNLSDILVGTKDSRSVNGAPALAFVRSFVWLVKCRGSRPHDDCIVSFDGGHGANVRALIFLDLILNVDLMFVGSCFCAELMKANTAFVRCDSSAASLI